MRTLTAETTMTTGELWSWFDRWAGALLMVFAIVSVAAAIAVASATDDAFVAIAILAAGALAGLVDVVAIYGLGWDRAWARSVVVTLLWWAVLIGIVQVAIALTRNSLLLPFGAIAGVFVLRMRPRPRPAWPDGHPLAAMATIVVMSASLLLPLAAETIMRPDQSPLSVGAGAIAVSADVTCRGSVGAPTEIRATAAWRWSRRELLPHGIDGLAFRWRFADPNHETIPPGVFELTDAPGTGFRRTAAGAVDPGRDGSTGPFWRGTDGPAGATLNALMNGPDQLAAAVEPIMIDIDRQRQADDRFVMVLRPSQSFAPASGTLTFDVAYVHAGRWTVWSDPASCTW